MSVFAYTYLDADFCNASCKIGHFADAAEYRFVPRGSIHLARDRKTVLLRCGSMACQRKQETALVPAVYTYRVNATLFHIRRVRKAMGSDVRFHLMIPSKIGLARVYCLNNIQLVLH
jgi:hypothetical protein